MDKRPLANEILKALKRNEKEPIYSDFENVSKDDFGDAVQYLEDEGYIRGSTIVRGGMGNKVQVVWLKDAKITERGYQLLDVIES